MQQKNQEGWMANINTAHACVQYYSGVNIPKCNACGKDCKTTCFGVTASCPTYLSSDPEAIITPSAEKATASTAQPMQGGER